MPCGTCRACCSCGYDVDLIPTDDPRLERTDSPRAPFPVLPKNADGSCVYLSEAGCSVYNYRPAACREYDCRAFVYAGLVPDRPALIEAVLQWSPARSIKTREDRLAFCAFRAAALHAYSAGNATEDACLSAVLRWRKYLPLAREMAALVKADPAAAARLMHEAVGHLRQHTGQ